MKVMHRGACLVAALALAGCGADAASPPKACTQMAARLGIGVHVGAQLSDSVRTAHLTVCQRGKCRQESVELRPSKTSIDQGCDGGVCGAKASPTGQLHGFAYLPKLTTTKAQVRLVLRGESGESEKKGHVPVLDRQITVDPELVHPNGPDCGGEAPQANLTITKTNGIRVTQLADS